MKGKSFCMDWLKLFQSESKWQGINTVNSNLKKCQNNQKINTNKNQNHRKWSEFFEHFALNVTI